MSYGGYFGAAQILSWVTTAYWRFGNMVYFYKVIEIVMKLNRYIRMECGCFTRNTGGMSKNLLYRTSLHQLDSRQMYQPTPKSTMKT